MFGVISDWIGLIGGIVGIASGAASVFSAKSAATSNRIAKDALEENKKITKVTLEDAIHSSQENDMEWEYSFYDVDVAPGRSRIDFESDERGHQGPSSTRCQGKQRRDKPRGNEIRGHAPRHGVLPI